MCTEQKVKVGLAQYVSISYYLNKQNLSQLEFTSQELQRLSSVKDFRIFFSILGHCDEPQPFPINHTIIRDGFTEVYYPVGSERS